MTSAVVMNGKRIVSERLGIESVAALPVADYAPGATVRGTGGGTGWRSPRV